MVNCNRKGKNTERAIVAWLKESGIASARRSQQFAGDPLAGESDVIAPEHLPDFHIEVKGTQSAKLTRSQLKAWYKQLEEDCPKHKIPVLFNKANGKDIIGIVTIPTAKALWSEWLYIKAETEDSVVPSSYLERIGSLRRVESVLELCNAAPRIYAISYELEKNKFFLILEGAEVLKAMVGYKAGQLIARAC